MRTAVVFLLATIFAACAAGSSASSVVYRKETILKVPVHVVYVNLNDQSVKVTVAISKRGRGSSESAESIISRTRPAAAITGTFFDTRTLLPTGDIVIGGISAHSGCIGPALYLDFNNQACIIPQKYRSRYTSGNYQTIIAGGPTLVDCGNISLNPRAEGFRDPSLFRPARRTAIGLTSANKLLLVSVDQQVSMHTIGRIMAELGAVQAMLLDGGSSTALYANGRFVSRPGRKLTNLLLVYETHDDYERAAGELAPTLISAQQITAAAQKNSSTVAVRPVDVNWLERLTPAPENNLLAPAPSFELAGLNDHWLLPMR